MDFIVTVPAIWSPSAKGATERAAAKAGFCGNQRISLISEPVYFRPCYPELPVTDAMIGSRSLIYFEGSQPIDIEGRAQVCRMRCRRGHRRFNIL